MNRVLYYTNIQLTVKVADIMIISSPYSGGAIYSSLKEKTNVASSGYKYVQVSWSF